MYIIVLNVKDTAFVFMDIRVANILSSILYILCIKLTLELATKAQRSSRGIALLFL
jgi:hypothetical protein